MLIFRQQTDICMGINCPLWPIPQNRFSTGSGRMEERRNPASILYKSIAGRYRPVSYPDGPITARYRFIKNVLGKYRDKVYFIWYFRVGAVDTGHYKVFVRGLRKPWRLLRPRVAVSSQTFPAFHKFRTLSLQWETRRVDSEGQETG